MFLKEKHLQFFKISKGVRLCRQDVLPGKALGLQVSRMFTVSHGLWEGLGWCVQDLPCISPVSFLLLKKDPEKWDDVCVGGPHFHWVAISSILQCPRWIMATNSCYFSHWEVKSSASLLGPELAFSWLAWLGKMLHKWRSGISEARTYEKLQLLLRSLGTLALGALSFHVSCQALRDSMP